MSEPMRPMLRHGHVSVTHITQDGTTHTEVHVSEVSYASGAVGDVVENRVVVGGAVENHVVVGGAVVDGAVDSGAVEDAVADDDAMAGGADVDGECFNPETCCDARERAMITMLRAYLRPEAAPECLLTRLRATLDRCCCDDDSR